LGLPSYIVVEGPIGVGKTSLAHLLAGLDGADLLLEQPEANPFLGNFYQDPRRWALATQLFFLFQRVNQLSGLKQLDLFERPTVADFLFDKDPMFARLTLSDDEFALYQRIYEHLAPQAVAPDLVIYLQAPVETLMVRVRRRAAAYERGISEEYLARLTEAYGRFFHAYDAAPLLIVNSRNLNFVDRPGDFDLLLQRISEMRGAREFFSLA
jgi:deoxyadenosine/deoxycytidine kinase